MRKTLPAIVQTAMVGIVLTIGLMPFAMAKETTLYSFTNGADGGHSFSGLITDSSGNLYGAASSGGEYGNGVVFELTPNGTGWDYNVIYAFTGGADGGFPTDQYLTFDSKGNLYGTTTGSGSAPNGTVFELSPGSGVTWDLTRNYVFTGGSDGANPSSDVVFDSAGNIYTTTTLGALGFGTVIQLTPSGSGWTEETLYTFAGGKDGGQSYSGLTWSSTGSLYGTAAVGGAHKQGVVFELQKSGSGWAETVLYSFTGANGNGSTPYGNVVLDKSGNLYSTTYGTTSGATPGGAVFKLTPGSTLPWKITWLHHFTSGFDGTGPETGVVFDSNGNLYGTTYGGDLPGCSSIGCGAVFELSPPKTGAAWKETLLWSFTGGSDGGIPFDPLYVDKAGNIYGTTNSQGASNAGTIFEWSRVTPQTSTTKLTSSANPAPVDQTITFTVSVTGAIGTPQGTVTLKDGSTVLGKAVLVNGEIQFNIATLTVGQHTIKASYSGSSDYKTSSASIVQMIN